MRKLDKVEKCIQKGKEKDLIKLADDREKEVQLAAIAGMGQIGIYDSFNTLISMLQAEDVEIRIAVITALGQLKNRHAETYLRHLLERENNDAIKKALLDALDVLRKEGR